MSEDLYRMLQDRDREIAGLREIVSDLRYAVADFVSEEAKERAYAEVEARLKEIYYDHGFKSDGRMR